MSLPAELDPPWCSVEMLINILPTVTLTPTTPVFSSRATYRNHKELGSELLPSSWPLRGKG